VGSRRRAACAGFYVEVKITSRKSSRDEKARYVREVNRALEGLLGARRATWPWTKSPQTPGAMAGETQEVRYARAVHVT